MADLLTQFDIVERAEQARNKRRDRDLGDDGSSGARDILNPFDEEQSPVAAIQVPHMSHYWIYYYDDTGSYVPNETGTRLSNIS